MEEYSLTTRTNPRIIGPRGGREVVGNPSCSDSYRSFTRRDVLTHSRRWARIALEVLRRLPGDEDEYKKLINYQNAAIDVSKRVFREFFAVSGAASSVTKER